MENLSSLAKRIEQSNEQFKTMTNEEKKVQIAIDCIERIQSEQLKAVEGSFIRFASIDKLMGKNDLTTPIKGIINTKFAPQCEVCAKGGLFLSYVGRVNEFNLDNLSGHTPNDIRGNEHQKLLEIFTPRELAHIEYAFEGSQFLHYDTVNKCDIVFTEKERQAIGNFYEQFLISNDRLIAICENIIENKGAFNLSNFLY